MHAGRRAAPKRLAGHPGRGGTRPTRLHSATVAPDVGSVGRARDRRAEVRPPAGRPFRFWSTVRPRDGRPGPRLVGQDEALGMAMRPRRPPGPSWARLVAAPSTTLVVGRRRDQVGLLQPDGPAASVGRVMSRVPASEPTAAERARCDRLPKGGTVVDPSQGLHAPKTPPSPAGAAPPSRTTSRPRLGLGGHDPMRYRSPTRPAVARGRGRDNRCLMPGRGCR